MMASLTNCRWWKHQMCFPISYVVDILFYWYPDLSERASKNCTGRAIPWSKFWAGGGGVGGCILFYKHICDHFCNNKNNNNLMISGGGGQLRTPAPPVHPHPLPPQSTALMSESDYIVTRRIWERTVGTHVHESNISRRCKISILIAQTYGMCLFWREHVKIYLCWAICAFYVKRANTWTVRLIPTPRLWNSHVLIGFVYIDLY